MKKVADNKKSKVMDDDRGLVDPELEKEVAELKKKLKKEITEAKKNAKKKKGK